MKSDRREWFRCKVLLDGNDQALLRAGDDEHRVRLVNASAGGYAATCHEPLEFKVGKLLLLQTTGGWIEVRVIRLERKAGATHLGLERVQDLGDDVPRSWLDMLGGRRAALMLCGALVVGTVLGISLALLLPKLLPLRTNEAAAPTVSALQTPPRTLP